MKKQIAILGRQSKISLAELESLLGSEKIIPIEDYGAIINTSEALPQNRLGGTIKSGSVIAELKNNNISAAFNYINENLIDIFGNSTDKKLKIGFSVYGFELKREELLKRTLSIKKALRKTGQSVRIVENKTLQMSSAQVLYNKLTDEAGFELLIIKNGNDTIIAKTYAVQDIDAYGKRDFGRPKRDARVGMLPPKLAQIIINLTVGDTNPKFGAVVLDPFCGTGVVLQEAALMGFDIYGSDIEPRMIEYTKANLDWLNNLPDSRITAHSETYYHLKVADATNFIWLPLPSFIACETYLGQPLSSEPKPEVFTKIIDQVDKIHLEFLKNVAKQTAPGFKMCLALPAWKTKSGFVHLKVLENLRQLGYTRLVFKHAEIDDLVYHRPNQIVARELTVLVRN